MSSIKVKLATVVLKYIPILTAFLMMVHALFLILGKHFIFAECLSSLALLPAIVIYFVSDALKFCWLHKSFTLYTLVVDGCIKIQRYFNFGEYLTISRIIVLFIGLILFSILIINFKKYCK